MTSASERTPTTEVSAPALGPTAASVVVVSSDSSFVGTTTDDLAASGVAVASVRTVAAALRLLGGKRPVPDACLVDLELGEGNAWVLLAAIERERLPVPVLAVDVRRDEQAQARALGHGAAEYLVKPIARAKLAYRLRALSEPAAASTAPPSRPVIAEAELRLDPTEREAFIGGSALGLTLAEFELLYALAAARGTVLSRDELLGHALGRVARGRTRVVDVLIVRIRKKLARSTGHSFIQTERGSGYRFERRPPLHVARL